METKLSNGCFWLAFLLFFLLYKLFLENFENTNMLKHTHTPIIQLPRDNYIVRDTFVIVFFINT